MQKKLSFALSIMLLTGLTNSVNAADWSGLKTAGTLVGLGMFIAGGQYAQKANKEYAQNGKDPDAALAMVKVGATASVLFTLDLLRGNGDLKENLVKLAAFGLALPVGCNQVAQALDALPTGGIGDLLHGPMVDGKEKPDAGTAARIMLAYIPLRDVLLDVCGSNKSSKLSKD